MPEPDHGERPAVTVAAARFDEVRRRIGLLLGPALFIAVLLIPFPTLPPAAHRLAAVMSLVIVLWVTEAIPIPVTALLGPTLAVMLGVAPVRDAFAPMADPLIFFFIGSFMLAQALFVHRVNERIAYGVLSWKLIGARPGRILVAYGGIAALLSAWMSNTATAAMLVPIGLSLLAFMESEGRISRSYGTVLVLMTAYGCSLGGTATPVGTPPNLIAIGHLRNMAGVHLTFVEWMFFAVPVAVVMLGLIFVYMNFVGGAGAKEIAGADEIIRLRKQSLGAWKPGERNALIAFGVTVTLWGRARDRAPRLGSGTPGGPGVAVERARGGRRADRRRPAVPPADQLDPALDPHLETGGADRLGDDFVVWRRLGPRDDALVVGTGGGDRADDHGRLGRTVDLRGGALYPRPVGNDVEYGGDQHRCADRDRDRSGRGC